MGPGVLLRDARPPFFLLPPDVHLISILDRLEIKKQRSSGEISQRILLYASAKESAMRTCGPSERAKIREDHFGTKSSRR